MEKQWLLNNNKKQVGRDHNVEDLELDIENLRRELKDEKEKV